MAITVTTNLDEDTHFGATMNDDLNDGDGFSLREAIYWAAAVDNIAFDESLAGTTIVLTQGADIDVAKTILSIDGDIDGDGKADITISGNNSSRIFDLTTGGLDLFSLNLTGGNSYGQSGGAIKTAIGTILNIYDSTISGNTNNSNGGGIYTAGTLRLTDSTISGNTSNYGGGLTLGTTSVATLKNTTVDGNSAIDGGGISSVVSSTLTTYNSTITDNAATGDGGGIYMFNGATVTLNNTVVALNSSSNAYHAIAELGTNTLSMYNSFTDAPVGEVDNGTNSDGSNAKLGALQDNGGTVHTRALMPGSSLINAGDNSKAGGLTTDANGDQRTVATTVDVGATEFQLTVTTAADQIAGASLAADIADGGGLSLREALRWADAGDTISFDSSLSGKTIFLANGELVINKSLTIDGDINGDDKADVTLSGDGDKDGSGNSRVFDISSGNVILNSLTLTDGYSGSVGGAIFLHDTATSLTINDSTISDGSAITAGGGIFADSNLTVNNSTIDGNSAEYGGGLFVARDNSVTLSGSTIHNNSASEDGGGIDTDGNTKLTINNSTITGNSATDVGGGIDLFGGSLLIIDNSVVANNTANTGIDVGESGADSAITANYSVFSNGTGLIIDAGAYHTIIANPKLGPLQDNGGPVQTQNLAPDSPLINGGDNGYVPGGLTEDANGNPRTVAGTVDIGATEFQLVVTQNNDTDTVSTLAADLTDGGGLSLREAIAHAGAGDTITFDSSLKGSTLVLKQGELSLTKDLTIDGDTDGDDKADIIISGDANGSGTGDAGDSRIFNMGSFTDVTLKSLTLTDGYVNGGGGAIYAGVKGVVNLIDSTVRDNAVTGQGGGIYSQGTVNATNSTISGNAADGAGGGVFVGGAATFINATIDGNTAGGAGGGIGTYGTNSLTIRDSTITSNTATGIAGGIQLLGGTTATITNSVLALNSGSGASDDIGRSGGPIYFTAGNSFFGTTVTINTDLGGNTNTGGNPLLGELLDNGGTVLTRSPLDGSPLIGVGRLALLRADLGDVDDDGNTSELLSLDGRGGNRVVGALDIGAVEKVTNEKITGTAAANTILGGTGADTLDGGSGNDTVNGGSGSDTLRGGDGNDTLNGDGGNDHLAGGNNNDRLLGGDGHDTLKGGGGNDLLFGNNNNDKLFGEAGTDTLNGGDGNDSLVGGDGSDLLIGANGNDTLKGDAGNDSLVGGNNNDKLFGGNGVDTLRGDGGNDSLLGGNQNDKLFGGNGVDTLRGDGGNDSLLGGNQNDMLFGGNGVDTLRGDGGNDSLLGGNQNDMLFGGNGADTLRGDAHNDILLGGNQNDQLLGGDGNDTLKGDGGNDMLTGDRGNDQIIGGIGTDTAAFAGTLGRYNVTKVGTKIKVVDTLGVNGIDLLSSVERLKFGNTVLTVAQALQGSSPGAQNAAPTANDRDISSSPAGFDTGAEALRAEASGLTADDLLV